MRRLLLFLLVTANAIVCAVYAARVPEPRYELASPPERPDVVGEIHSKASTVQADTVWIANWDFDAGSRCDDTGWERHDLRAPNDGSLFWSVGSGFAGTGSFSGNAAILGRHDLCWVYPDGYDNDWYQAIRIEFVAPSFLSFDYIVDSESGYDDIRVEVDSGCASFDRVDFRRNPDDRASNYRDIIWSQSGFDTLGVVDSLSLGAGLPPGVTHCAYISFRSDGGWAPSDGLQASTLGIAVAIDNLEVAGATAISADFETPLDPRLTFQNLLDRAPFGAWGRLHYVITDNDPCASNFTCAWLWTDHTTPTLATVPDMAFAPGGYVVKNWLDNVIVSPWISWSSEPGTNTVLSFRRFRGNHFGYSRIVQNWSVHGRYRIDNTDSPSPGDSIDCVTEWGHRSSFNSLSTFKWQTEIFDMTQYIEPQSSEIQIRFRVTDWQLIAGTVPPWSLIPGPGPFLDDVRVGRVLAGPGTYSGPRFNEGIDSRSQAQDAFPTFRNGIPGEHFSPSQDRFGTTAFSRSGDLAVNGVSPNLITGDSIHVQVTDVEEAGGIVSVQLYASVVAGPHAGKAPPPWSAGGNGFFAVSADSARNASGQVVANAYYVDLDDDYFRGGDKLLYFWFAEDGLGHKSSDPAGLTELPRSVEEAIQATGGLLEVSFLPSIEWDPAYLSRIAGDPHGKLAPTPEELTNSAQSTCILYVQAADTRRRSASRTNFMHTLDRLGYSGQYDVYDLQGLGNTNNHLGGRASVAQATGYALIVFDAGDLAPGAPIMPDGVDLDSEKVDQNQWFRNWLAQAAQSEVAHATLWAIGSNIFEEKPFASLYTRDMGVGFVTADQGMGQSPQVQGLTSFTFHNGATVDFTGDDFVASPLVCDAITSYDGLIDVGTAVMTHHWAAGTGSGDASVIMNAKPSLRWSTIAMAFPWSDIVDPPGPPAQESTRERLAGALLSAVLLPGCVANVPTHARTDETSTRLPRRTTLHQNHPNPFNPATTIRFDLATTGRVRLRIYDVAGRLVRDLVDEAMPAGFGRTAIWNGLDDASRRVSSGVYLYQLEFGDFTATRKLIFLE